MKEIDIERDVLNFCLTVGIFAFKVRSTGSMKGGKFIKPPKYHRAGVSDIVGVINGHPFFCELKTPKGKLEEHQETFLKDAFHAGGHSFVARSLDEFIKATNFIKALPSRIDHNKPNLMI
jgi:hypothetical protein